jgi:hypothetical protein
LAIWNIFRQFGIFFHFGICTKKIWQPRLKADADCSEEDQTRVARFFRATYRKDKIYQIYQHLLSQDPPKFTQKGIFGLKICHLATLHLTKSFKKSSLMKHFAGNGGGNASEM